MDNLIVRLRNPAWQVGPESRLQPEVTQRDMAEAAAELERLRAEREWRPIETAPDDGQDILVIGGRHEAATIRAADGDRWRANVGKLKLIPTHWQPLPAPPAAGEP